MAYLDGLAAARNFRFQARDPGFQFMGGKGADILAQHDIGQLLARLKIVEVHGFGSVHFAH